MLFQMTLVQYSDFSSFFPNPPAVAMKFQQKFEKQKTF